MSILKRRSKADRHKAAADLYVAQGGSPAVRDRGDRGAAQIAQAQQRAALGRAELARHR